MKFNCALCTIHFTQAKTFDLFPPSLAVLAKYVSRFLLIEPLQTIPTPRLRQKTKFKAIKTPMQRVATRNDAFQCFTALLIAQRDYNCTH